MPSIASDSARTLTSPPPLHRLVISLSFSHPSLRRCSFLHLTSFIFLSLPSHACHLSSVPLPSFSSLLHRPSFISLSSSIVLSEHLLSLPASAIFYLDSSSFLLLSFFLSVSLCCLCSPSFTCEPHLGAPSGASAPNLTSFVGDTTFGLAGPRSFNLLFIRLNQSNRKTEPAVLKWTFWSF